MENVETFFVTVLNADGTLTTWNKIPENLPTEGRPANNLDIYNASKQIVDEFQNSMLADRVARQVIASLAPATQKVSDKVADALKERGINPESITPAE